MVNSYLVPQTIFSSCSPETQKIIYETWHPQVYNLVCIAQQPKFYRLISGYKVGGANCEVYSQNFRGQGQTKSYMTLIGLHLTMQLMHPQQGHVFTDRPTVLLHCDYACHYIDALYHNE